MNKMTRKLLSLVAVMVMLLTFTISATKAQDTASLRFVHVIPGLTAIDVYVNDSLSVEQLDFGQGSTYISVPAGAANVRVTLAGLTTVLWEQNVDLAAGDAATLIASSITNIQFDVFLDDLSELAVGNTRLTIVNLINESPAVDIQVSGDQIETQTIAFGVEYQGVFGPTSQPPADTYLISIVPSDGSEALIQDTSVSLNSLTSQIVVLYGTAVAPATLTLSAPTSGNSDSGFVRIAHGVADAPSVDVLVDGAKVAPSLSYGEATDHLAVPAGEHTISLQVAGSGSDVLSETVIVEAGTASTIAALGTVDTLSVAAFNDDISATGARTALVSVINTLADSDGVTVVIDGATVIADGLASGSASETTVINPPVSGEVAVSVAGGAADGQSATSSEVLYGGVYYNALVLNDSNGLRVAFFPTSLTQTINSAPNAVDLVEAVEPTVEPTAEPAAEPTEVVEAAPEPTATLAITQPTEDTGLPTARVLLDPGANLQLRLYPSSEAASIGLAPSGSVLTVNGREGAPIDVVTGEEIPVDDAGNLWVDPAEGLEAGSDLEPGATWLNVNFTTVNGGVIVAWVNAQYLEVLDAEGEIQRLAELPTIPQNQAGEGVNTMLPTAIPPVEEGPITATILLDPGVNLQLRQYPSSDALSLGGAPSGSTVIVNGREGAPIDIVTGEELPIDDAGNMWVDPAEGLAADADLVAGDTWLNIEYSTDDGGTITAWVNALYVSVRDGQGNPQRLADLETIPGNDPGEATNTSVVAPTPETFSVMAVVINLDPTTNLNIRRLPSTEGEVLARVNVGQELEFLGEGQSGEWVFVSYTTPEGGNVTGWTSTQYIQYEYKGAIVTEEELVEQNLWLEADEETVIGEVSANVAPVVLPTIDPFKDAFVATIVLDPDARLNLRRIPSTDGEVLANMPSGAQIVVTSRTEDAVWIEVIYDGTTGWTASQFVTIAYNGESRDVLDVPINTTINQPDATATPDPASAG